MIGRRYRNTACWIRNATWCLALFFSDVVSWDTFDVRAFLFLLWSFICWKKYSKLNFAVTTLYLDTRSTTPNRTKENVTFQLLKIEEWFYERVQIAFYKQVTTWTWTCCRLIQNFEFLRIVKSSAWFML